MGLLCRLLVIAGITTTLAAAGGSGPTVFGRNLIANPGAEAGEVSMPEYTGSVPAIPGWTRVGKTDVIPYGRFMDLGHLAPMNHLANYFVGGWSNASSLLTQGIDLSEGAATIDGGGVTFDASAYLGDDFGKPDHAAMTVRFLDGEGHELQSITLGPVAVPPGQRGMLFQRRIGAVPRLARSAVVSVEFTRLAGADNDGAADDLSLVLHAPAAADTVLHRNLLVNPGAEAGPAAANGREVATDVPGWTRSSLFSVERYDPHGRFSPVMAGPGDRGASLFTAVETTDVATGVQDVDVSAAAGPIDGGAVRYSAAGWFAGASALTVEFRDWDDVRLGAVALGPATASREGVVPPGTRQIRVELQLARANANGPNDGCADGLSLVLSSSGAPVAPAISSVRSAESFGGFAMIAPGTWIEITGNGLASTTREWATGDFNGALAPRVLDGVSVSVGGKSAVVKYVSPGQVNALVPGDVGVGSAAVVVSRGGSSVGPYAATVRTAMPGLLAPESFRVGGKQHVVALLPDWRTYVLPAAARLGVVSRPAMPGEEVILLGIGFGGVAPDVPEGAVAGQANLLVTPVEIRIGGVVAEVKYAGLSPGYVGLYQFNVVVPALAETDAGPVTFRLGDTAGLQTLFLAIGR